MRAWLAAEAPSTECVARGVSRNFLQCSLDPVEASALLGVRFELHADEAGRTAWRAEEGSAPYTVPVHVADALDFVGGVHRLPPCSREATTLAAGTSAGKSNNGLHFLNTPEVIRKAYNVGSAKGGAAANNSQAVAQFLGQKFLPTDLVEFFTLFGLRFEHDLAVHKKVGPAEGIAGVEASLDIEYIMSTGNKIPTTFWATGGLHEQQEPFLEWLQAVEETDQPPLIFSVSYGDDESSLDPAYMRSVDAELAKLGLAGITVLFASGDSGAGCMDAPSGSGEVLSPSFPASSPHVLAVGGTQWQAAGQGYAGDYISGGGFSNEFVAGPWQHTAVQQFLATSTSLPDASKFNNTGRAYPDVSAFSESYPVVTDLIPTLVGGTSAACPTFAGVLGLVNDARLAAGQSSLGLVAPLLYKNAAALADVTKGCNAGCGSSPEEGSEIGFCAMAGWDPVTGLGSPDYEKLKGAALGEPATTLSSVITTAPRRAAGASA